MGSIGNGQRLCQLLERFDFIKRVGILRRKAGRLRVKAAGGALCRQDRLNIRRRQARGLTDGRQAAAIARQAPHHGGLVAPPIREAHAAAVAPIPEPLGHGAADEGHHAGGQGIGLAGARIEPERVVAAAALQQALSGDQVEVIERHASGSRHPRGHRPRQLQVVGRQLLTPWRRRREAAQPALIRTRDGLGPDLGGASGCPWAPGGCSHRGRIRPFLRAMIASSDQPCCRNPSGSSGCDGAAWPKETVLKTVGPVPAT